MRVHEIAKELDVPSKDLLEMLHGLGVEAKKHMTTLEEADVKRLRDAVAKAKKAGTLKKPEPPKPVAKPVPVKPEKPKEERKEEKKEEKKTEVPKEEKKEPKKEEKPVEEVVPPGSTPVPVQPPDR